MNKTSFKALLKPESFHQPYYRLHSHYRIEPPCITEVLTSPDYQITPGFLSGRFTKRTGIAGLPGGLLACHRGPINETQCRHSPAPNPGHWASWHIIGRFPPTSLLALDNSGLQCRREEARLRLPSSPSNTQRAQIRPPVWQIACLSCVIQGETKPSYLVRTG